MMIPPQRMQDKLRSNAVQGGKVRLQSAHLLVDHEVANIIFANEPNVNMIYYADRGSLLIAPSSDELFKKLHKAKQHMLKNKSIKGDKSIALHELLIDHEIDQTDRDLEYILEKNLNILNVKL